MHAPRSPASPASPAHVGEFVEDVGQAANVQAAVRTFALTLRGRAQRRARADAPRHAVPVALEGAHADVGIAAAEGHGGAADAAETAESALSAHHLDIEDRPSGGEIGAVVAVAGSP